MRAIVLSAAFAVLATSLVSGQSIYLSNSEYAPNKWADTHPACNGTKQSPINVRLSAAVNVSGPVILTGGTKTPSSIRYKNDQPGLEIMFKYADGIVPTLSGGPMGTNVYRFDTMIIKEGSEHMIDGVRPTIEVQTRFLNNKYPLLGQALIAPDGVVMLATFMNKANSTLVRPVFTASGKVAQVGLEIEETTVYPMNRIIQGPSYTVYAYDGSFTIPPCSENVKWLIVASPIPSITTSEYSLLTAMGSLANSNIRAVKSAIGRVITRYA